MSYRTKLTLFTRHRIQRLILKFLRILKSSNFLSLPKNRLVLSSKLDLLEFPQKIKFKKKVNTVEGPFILKGARYF